MNLNFLKKAICSIPLFALFITTIYAQRILANDYPPGNTRLEHSSIIVKPSVKPSTLSPSQSTEPVHLPDFAITKEDAENCAKKVDEIVSKNFYDAKVAVNVWPKAFQSCKSTILTSHNLKELAERMNKPLEALHSSHTEFVTTNDEIYYFLDSMFGLAQQAHGKKRSIKMMDFTGITTGGVDKTDDCIRYVLNGSPAFTAGLQRGDIISSVNGIKYVGQSNFEGLSKVGAKIQILRAGQSRDVSLTPRKAIDYSEYVKAIEGSSQIFSSSAGKLGYVRYWCGGRPAHDAFEETVLSEKILNTEGLIVDLRDGYGGNSSEDFDVFFRPPAGYATFKSIDRKGKVTTDQSFYDKPIVVLINRGSRSGKELLAFNIQKSGRGLLVGETTAGFFLGGSLFSIDGRTAIYLAVIDAFLNDTTRLEGKGVSPDRLVPDDAEHPDGFAVQLETAKEALVDLISKKKNVQFPAKSIN